MNIIRLFSSLLIGIFCLSISFGGCSPKAPEPEVTTEQQIKEYQDQAQAKIKDLSAKIEDLSNHALASARHTKAEVGEMLSELNEKRTAAQLKLDELKTETGRAWDEIKKGLEAALDDLERSYSRATAEYRD